MQSEQIRQKELLSINEFAWLISCSTRQVEREIERGRIPIVKLGRLTRIKQSEVPRYVRLLEDEMKLPR